MSRDDVDPEHARRLAWRVLKADESVDQMMEQAAASEAPEGESRQAFRREAEAACDELAAAVERTWAMRDPALQAQSVTFLLRHGDSLGLKIGAMANEHGREGVRLLRLAVRHWHHLSPAAQKALSGVAMWIPLDEGETTDLIVEVARAGIDALLFGFELQFHDRRSTLGDRWPALPARLGDVLDEAQDENVRDVTLALLGLVGAYGAEASLVRALELPYLGVRAAAMNLLFDIDPNALSPEQAMAQFQDVFDHPPWCVLSCRSEVPSVRLADALQRALAAAHPPGAVEILKDLFDQVWNEFIETPFDRAWALDTLAAAYPVQALPLLRDELQRTDPRLRVRVVEAAAKLPDLAARELLLWAAADGASAVCERARVLWQERFGEPCPGGEMWGVPLALLGAAPDDARLREQVGVLRGSDAAARRKLLRSLLTVDADAAGARKAVGLIALALSDEDLCSTIAKRGKFTSPRETCWKKLHDRFGPSALDASLWLAERYAGDRHYHGWFYPLEDAVRKMNIRAADRPALAEQACRLLAGDEAHVQLGIALVQRLGGAAAAWEPLWAMALGPEATHQWSAQEALRHWQPRREANQRAVREMEAGIAARDFGRVAAAAAIGVRRGSNAAIQLAERLLQPPLEEAEAALDACRACARALHDMGRIDDAWIESALIDPALPQFVIGSHLVLRWSMNPLMRERLEDALGSPARANDSAEEAAHALVFKGAQGRDLRLRGVLERATPMNRWKLVRTMEALQVPQSVYHPHFVGLLATTDEAIVTDIGELLDLSSREEEGLQTMLREGLPRVTHAWLRERIARFVAKEGDHYWKDDGED